MKFLKRSKNLKFITNFTLSGCSTTVGSINWKRLEKLVHLDISNIWISFEFMFNCLSRLNENLRHLSLRNIHLHSFNEASEAYFQGSFHLMQTRCRAYLKMSRHQFENHKSFDDGTSGFPELRYLRFEGRFSKGNTLSKFDWMVFQYCCEKSPKLEHIHFVDRGSNRETIKYVSKSIGSLLSRPTLRSLFIKINVDMYKANDEANDDRFLELFNCPKEKPKLENLSLLIPNLKLSVIGQFVEGNLNLKKLWLDTRLWILNKQETFEKNLLKLITTDHGMEEIRFVKHGLMKPWSTLDERWLDRTILRKEFPELVSYLGRRNSEYRPQQFREHEVSANKGRLLSNMLLSHKLRKRLFSSTVPEYSYFSLFI